MALDIIIIILLIVLNGIFSMSELAVVSSRRSRLQALAENGSRKAKVALDLKDDPSKFLSVVQVGITLIGILSGAYSGATVAGPLGEYLDAIPLLAGRGSDLAIGIVVASVTYISLIIGELVPKQIALRHADGITLFIAIPILWLTRLTRPIVLFLDVSNNFILKLIRLPPDSSSHVSGEEVKAIIAEGTQSGVFNAEEQKMMEGVLRLSDLAIKATMTHRQDIVWLEADETLESIAQKIRASQHSHYLLCDKSHADILGIASAKDIVVQLQAGEAVNLRSLVQEPITLPETTSVHDAIAIFRKSRAHIALVVDEYGSLEGIVTLKDILETIVGTMPEPNDHLHSLIVQREDGSYLLDGLLPIYEAESLLQAKNMQEESADYSTLAGFLLHRLKRLPKEGDIIEWQSFRFEIIDMDQRRIDKVLVSRQEHSV